MANFREVNKAIKADFPNLKVEIVRGEGYVYFTGMDDIESIYVHPVNTTTEELINLCYEQISDVLAKRDQADEKVESEEEAKYEGKHVYQAPVHARVNEYKFNVNETLCNEIYKHRADLNKLTPSKLKHLNKLAKYFDRVK